MLGSIRRRTKGTFAYIIVAIITVPFLLVGLSDYLTTTDERGIYVGDVKISKTKIDTVVKQKIEDFKKLTKGEGVDFSEQIRAFVESDLIKKELLVKFQIKNGVQANVSDIQSEIQKMPVFQIDDKFSVDRYKDILKINNFTTAQYEDEIMRLLAIANVEELLFAPVSSMNNNLLKAIMDESKEVRLKLIKINDINGDIVPTNEQLVDKFKENKAQYQTQRKISVDYVELTDESILNTIDVSQELIDNAYTDYVNNTKKAITYSIVQDQLDTEALANESLANLISLDNESKDYQLKAMDVQPGDLGEEMEAIIFGMTEGESKVFESSFGWHAVIMSSLNRVVVNTQEQMSPKLRKTLQEEKLLIKKNKMIDEMNAVLYEDGMDALASQFDGEILSIADTTKGFLIWTPESNSKLWKDTEVGGTGILDETNKTVFYSIKSIAQPRQMTFEDAKSLVSIEVLEDITAKKKIELVSEELATENKDDWIKVDISRDLTQQDKLSLLVFGTMDSKPIASGWIKSNGQIFAYTTDGVVKQSDLWDSSVFNGIIDREKQQWFSYKKGKEYGIERKE